MIWNPVDAEPCDPPTDGVMVNTVVKPGGSPGPAGMVYVMTSTDFADEDVFPDEGEPTPEGVPAEDPGTVIVSGCGEAPAPKDPDVETVVCEPADGPLCVLRPDTVRVRTPVEPDGAPGPEGTV